MNNELESSLSLWLSLSSKAIFRLRVSFVSLHEMKCTDDCVPAMEQQRWNIRPINIYISMVTGLHDVAQMNSAADAVVIAIAFAAAFLS